MKKVSLLANVNPDICIGCQTCTKVCPVLAIHMENRKAVINPDKCRACANCADRCPVYAIKMEKREEPFVVKVDPDDYDHDEVVNLCHKAHMNPEQVLCYCTATRADEVAAAILGGAKTPEELSLRTGIRTGCTIECIEPMLRLLSAAGCDPKPSKKGWQWYGKTVTAWELPDDVKEKYNSRGFYFDEDKTMLDEIVNKDSETGGKR